MELIIERIKKLLDERNDEQLPPWPRRQFQAVILNLNDPTTYDTAVSTSRKVTEWYIKRLYAESIGKEIEQIGPIRSEQMMQTLQKEVPLGQQGILRSITSLQNYFSHAQADTSEINEYTVQGCLLMLLGMIESIDLTKPVFLRVSVPDGPRISTNEHGPLVMGIDVGTNKIAAGLISIKDPNRPVILEKTRVFHREIESEFGILEKIEHVASSIVNSCGLSFRDLLGVGIGLPGQVDYRTGYLKFAPGLKLRNVHVSSRLAPRLGTQVYADNDVNCSTLAELVWGQGDNFSNFICVFVGTGIGAGLVFDKRIYRGATLAAGEIGHMKVATHESARQCTCGAKGCFEEYASARAIIRMAREAIFEARERKLQSMLVDIDPESITPEDLVEAIKLHDKLGIQLAERIADSLAVGLSNLANVLNPEAIILGGGIINGFYGFDFFSSLVDNKFRELTLEVSSNTPILSSTFSGDDCPLLGAGSLAAVKLK